MIRDEGVHGTGPWSAVALGLTAHAAATGCLPALLPTLLVLPVALLAVRASDACLRHRTVLLRAAAGQVVVHVLLRLATTCSEHPAADAQGYAQPALDLAMTTAHIAALVLAMTAAVRMERSAAALLHSAAGWLCRTSTEARAAEPGPMRAAPALGRPGFVPIQVAHGRCGVTRGPPARRRCRAAI